MQSAGRNGALWVSARLAYFKECSFMPVYPRYQRISGNPVLLRDTQLMEDWHYCLLCTCYTYVLHTGLLTLTGIKGALPEVFSWCRHPYTLHFNLSPFGARIAPYVVVLSYVVSATGRTRSGEQTEQASPIFRRREKAGADISCCPVGCARLGRGSEG